jgi:cystathionine beta-lyase family protein involved in aluminum resistance
LSVSQIGEICDFVKSIKSDVCVLVDNCYGEFVEEKEPTGVGADLIVGSLIKNPGGAMAQTGGYIAGKKELVEKCADRLTSIGIGKEVGATLNQLRDIFKGLFLAPHITAQALKTAVFAAAVFQKKGFEVSPSPYEKRTDIIEVVKLGSKEKILSFCKGIQMGSPVDSFVIPEAWDMPGYDAQVVMAAGGFVQGSSIELSADAPIKEPFAVYFQGGITYESGKAGILLALNEMEKEI